MNLRRRGIPLGGPNGMFAVSPDVTFSAFIGLEKTGHGSRVVAWSLNMVPYLLFKGSK